MSSGVSYLVEKSVKVPLINQFVMILQYNKVTKYVDSGQDLFD